MTVFKTLIEILNAGNATYRLIEHQAEGRSDEVAKVRGTTPEQGAKAILCRLKNSTLNDNCLCVLSGTARLNMVAVANLMNAKRASFEKPDNVEPLTGCVIGAVPPISLWKNIPLLCDRQFLELNKEIAFNAGSLNCSIVLDKNDYVKIFCPKIVELTGS